MSRWPTVSDVHLFVLWSEARPKEAEIIRDLARRFRLLDLVEVTWSPDAFTRNLTCFYGSALPPGSEKERRCGTGPFLAVVVEDARPRYRPRRMRRGWARVNARTMDARRHHRQLTGGGFLVHASENRQEAERDLVLLFGRGSATFLPADPAGPRRWSWSHDVVGWAGWRDVDELVRALDVAGGCDVLEPPAGADLALRVHDRWWAEQLVGCAVEDDGVQLLVGGRSLRVCLPGAPGARSLRERLSDVARRPRAARTP